MTKKPSYRFAGYTEPWEEKKLGEVIDVNSGKDYKHLSKGKIPVYGTGGYMLSVSESLSDADGIGIGRKGTIDKPYILKAPFWTVDTLFYCIPRDAYNLYFVYSIFNNVTWKKFDESTGVPSLSKITINNIQSFLPSLPEQTAIGSFFQDIDQLIGLQQRKLEVLKEQKKTYLKLLFPAKGQTKPTLRFAGFEDEWKEVKLGEVYSFSQGQQVPVEEQFEQINENRIRFIRIVDLTNKGEEMRYIEFKSSTGRVYEKDIFFVRYGAVGVVGIGYDGIIANNLFKLNPQMSVDNKFMYVQFNREKFKKTLQGFSASTTMPAISFTDIRTIDIYLPSLPEQEAIGSFFQDLDKAIAKQEEKVNQLKESKQTLLRKMFI